MKFLLKDLKAVLVGLIAGILGIIMSNAFGTQTLVIIISILVGLYLCAVLVYQISFGFPILRRLSFKNYVFSGPRIRRKTNEEIAEESFNERDGQ